MEEKGQNGSPSQDAELGAVGGPSTRPHYDSDSSNSGEECPDHSKRQRTGHGFMIPGIAASPPKFVSLEEVIRATNGMNNMSLAHEIAVDRNFKLEKLVPADNSLEKKVKETLHKVFWDILDAELKETPPSFVKAMVLLEEVKEVLIALLHPNNMRMKQEILDVLDTELIRQQAEAGVLDFQVYAQYVISLMGKMCAPVRDENVKSLSQITDIIPAFQAIFETLDLMKLDMANYTISIIRPDIIAQSIEYERTKFAEFLAVQTDGLEWTRKWLLRHLPAVQAATPPDMATDPESELQRLTARTLAEAYLELLEWNEENLVPETLVMDEVRFEDLGETVRRLVVVGTVVLVTLSVVRPLQDVANFRDSMKQHLVVLLAELKSYRDLEKLMPNVAVQMLQDVNAGLVQHGYPALDAATQASLDVQIRDIVHPEHRIRQLVRQRVREFLQSTVTSSSTASIRFPPGLSSLRTELVDVTGQFVRLVTHNRDVFGSYYQNIISARCSSST